jgi:hypothetical protein
MNSAELPRTNIGGRARTLRFAAGFVVLFTLPVWNALAAAAGVQLRGLAAVAVFPVAWLGCLWLAESRAGVSSRALDLAEIVAVEPESLAELRARRRRVYLAATAAALLLVAAIGFASSR